MAQKESKLNLEMAAQQRRLAHASKRDSTAMKTLSLLGAVFLPGTFLSSVFSMTFFDFNVGELLLLLLLNLPHPRCYLYGSPGSAGTSNPYSYFHSFTHSMGRYPGG